MIVFDEIQSCPRALTSLKYFFEKQPELAICAAGSLLGVYLNEEESFPVGSIDTLNLHLMSFQEFALAVDPLLGKAIRYRNNFLFYEFD